MRYTLRKLHDRSLSWLRRRFGIIPDEAMEDWWREAMVEDGWSDVLNRAFYLIPAMFASRAGRLRYYQEIRHEQKLNQGTTRELIDFILTPRRWSARMGMLNMSTKVRIEQIGRGLTLYEYTNEDRAAAGKGQPKAN